jgi:hypothetical protein
MATVDTSIYGNLLRPVPTLMDNVNALDASDLQRTQLAGAKQNLIGQQQAFSDQQAVRALYQKPGFDPTTPAGLSALGAASPSTYLATQKAIFDNRKTQADTSKAAADAGEATAKTAGMITDQTVARTNRHLQQLVTVGDVPSAVGWINDAVASGELPAQQAQGVIAGLQSGQVALSDWKQKAMAGGLTLQQQRDAAQKDAVAAETARHNQADESNIIRGQNVTAATAAANRVAENKRAGYDANGNMIDLGLNPGAAPVVAPAATATQAIPTTPGGGPPAPLIPGAPAAAVPAQAAKSPLQGLVDGIGTYQSPESVALARMPAAQKSQVLAAVKTQYPDYDPGTYAERQASNRAFSANGKMGQAVKSFNVGLAHLDTLSDLATKLDNGQIPVLNAAGNYIAQQSGGTAQTNFAAAKNIVTDEVVKAIVGGGGGVGDRDKAAATINAAQNPQQLQQAIGTVKTLMGGQLVGLEQSYRAGTGKKDFRDKYLSPEAQKAFDSLQQNSGSTNTGVPPDIAAILAKHGGK